MLLPSIWQAAVDAAMAEVGAAVQAPGELAAMAEVGAAVQAPGEPAETTVTKRATCISSTRSGNHRSLDINYSYCVSACC